MQRLVTGAGHRVRAVNSGDEALRAVEADAFDVAVVDLEMPGMSGAATITKLRLAAPSLRVLVVSGYDDRRHVLEAFEAGADGYLLKDELADSLTRSLQEVRAGGAPLSARVAAIVLRQFRRASSEPRPAPTVERVREALGITKQPLGRITPVKLGRGSDQFPIVERPGTGNDDGEDR